MDKVKVFKSLLDKFETDEIRLYCEDMINKISDDIFLMPSSTSFKYHNKTQCCTHGQIFHILMFGEIMNYILDLEYIREKYPKERQRDCLRCTPIFHDAIKCGLNGSKFTVHEHPMLAGEWIRNTVVKHDIKQGLKDYIAKMCESHSGQWIESKRSKTILPKPESDDAFLVHMCDYLSSRSNLDMIYTEDVYKSLEDFEPELPKLEDYVLTFGKHKGEKLVDVAKTDSDYIRWVKENMTREPVKSLLAQM